ncbi:MAG: VWA domain-containing protein [Alphaproteobacteria bacterium]|nr:VWA domain-containing protein [Alphaproteobacteria bacterium]
MLLRKLISLLMLCFITVPALAGTNDGLVYSGKVGDYFHPQGECNFATGPIPTLCNAEYKPKDVTNLCESTWSCHGSSHDMVKATYANGLKICVYIDNSGDQGYFVPLNTAEEWNAFSDTNHTPPDVRIVVGCPGGVKQDPCGNKYDLPDTRVSDNPKESTFHFATTGDYAVDFSCPAHLTSKDKNGIETSVAVVNCGEWQIKETGSCVESAGLTFNGKACSKDVKSAEFVMVLDASASMDQLLGGAQNALRSLVGKYLVPRPDIPVTITVIGGEGYTTKLDDPSKENCPYGRLFGPLAADATQINSAITPVFANNNTPIDTTLRYSAELFQDASKRRVMLVLTDGFETCFGDPALAVKQLRDKGIEVYGIKYGDTNDADANNFFKAMNKFAPANSPDEITAAVESIVKNVTEQSCKPILRLYTQGSVDGQGQSSGDALYTILAGQTQKVKRGVYDAVVDYCTGKQVFPAQKVETERDFNFNQNCTK